MKLEINFQKFKNAVGLVEKLAGKHMTLPVLSCILLEVSKTGVTFKTTNLDLGIEVLVAAKCDEVGTIAVPAHILSSFVSQVYDQNQIIKLELVSGNLQITTTKSKGVIKTVPADDFPTIPKITDGQKALIDTENIVKGLRSVWYSSSVSSVKPELSSVYVYRDGQYMTFVATDSFRLAERKVLFPQGTKMPDILIPFKNVSDIVRILEGMGKNVEVTSNKNLISFESDGVYLVSRLIDGVFPDYRQIIPKTSMAEVVVLKQDLMNALKISNIFSDKFNLVKIIIDPKGKTMEIQTRNSDVGENRTMLDAAITGDKVEINFNYKYIIDCFQSIDADSVSLQLSGMNRAMVVRPVSGDQNFMYLVMPMNR